MYGDHEDNKTTITTFLRPLKDLALESTTLNVKYLYEDSQIVFTSVSLIKSLYISCSKQYLKFSDNYFDVVPGHAKKVKILKSSASL